jgi:putative addiction module CopG family antidote
MVNSSNSDFQLQRPVQVEHQHSVLFLGTDVWGKSVITFGRTDCSVTFAVLKPIAVHFNLSAPVCIAGRTMPVSSIGSHMMHYSFPPDLRQFVDERLASGQYANEDDLLRAAFRVLLEEEQEFLAVGDAVDRFKQGEHCTPLDEAINRVRQQVEMTSNE